jgi:hypothetical protein
MQNFLLCLQGADPWAVDKLGSTALHYAAGEVDAAPLSVCCIAKQHRCSSLHCICDSAVLQ